MIVKALLNLVFGIINSLLSLIPTLSIEATNSISSSLTTLTEYMQKASIVLPLGHIFIVLGAIVSIPVFKMGWFIINWIIRRIVDVIP